MLDSHISTCFNKDTRDLFYVVNNARVPIISCSILLFLFDLFCCCLTLVRFLLDFCSSFVRHLFLFNSWLFHCSLFKRKILNSDPGLYSRYFDPVVQEVQCASWKLSPLNIEIASSPEVP